MKGFTEQTASLLKSLEAIDHIDRDAGRIYYSEKFKRHVISSWHGGERETAPRPCSVKQVSAPR